MTIIVCSKALSLIWFEINMIHALSLHDRLMDRERKSEHNRRMLRGRILNSVSRSHEIIDSLLTRNWSSQSDEQHISPHSTSTSLLVKSIRIKKQIAKSYLRQSLTSPRNCWSKKRLETSWESLFNRFSELRGLKDKVWLHLWYKKC